MQTVAKCFKGGSAVALCPPASPTPPRPEEACMMQDDVQCCRKTLAAALVTTLPQPPVCNAHCNAVVPFLPQKQKLQGCGVARHEVGTDLPQMGM